ncbi:hypothetical protein MesoLj131b_71740 (plasmid) [Mesorhizobium sp. 131-2-5]|nr:hypothetical protein MesoLj131b_71740 [Mesorhizobium sp. 131-2-5]
MCYRFRTDNLYCPVVVEKADPMDRTFQVVQHAIRTYEQLPSLVGQFDSPRSSIKQTGAYLRFEKFHLLAYRALCKVQRVRRERKAAQLGNRMKRSQAA